MTTKDDKKLRALLALAEQQTIDRINAKMPSDSVPDRIALPLLCRLEREQAEAEAAFDRVNMLIAALPL